MIQLRLKTFKSQSGKLDIPIKKGGEVLYKAIERSVKDVPLEDHSIEEVFQTLVNGHRIDSEFWHHTSIVESDSVLIAPKLGDDPGSIFKTIVVIAVTIAVSYATAGLGAVASAAITAGATIATNLALNALIPPPAPEGLDTSSGELSESQMYSITSQSNVPRKFQTVPKVYGTHRMFPIVAANPYVDTQLDPETKEEVQFLYAIYDFGFGPCYLSDFRIGDTPITSYSDVVVNIVDPLKPAVAEGPWDAQSRSTFQFYKRDNQIETLSVALNGNREEGGPEDTYQLTRNAAENPLGVQQEISLSFVNPSGLYGYGTNGSFVERKINLEIHFAEVGTSNWRGFNDEAYVSSFSAVGGDQDYDRYRAYFYPVDPGSITITGPLTIGGIGPYTQLRSHTTSSPYYGNQILEYWVGYASGATSVVLKYDSKIRVGTSFYYNGSYIGKVKSVASYGSYGGVSYYRYTFYSAIPEIHVYTVQLEKQFPTPVFKVVEGGITYEPDPNSPYGQKEQVATVKELTYDFGSPGEAVISRNVRKQAYSTFKFTPKKNADYKVRVVRVRTSSQYDYQTQDDLTVVSLRTRQDATPIITDKRHTFVEVKIRATNQLNGAIQNLSALCTSALDVYDPDTQTWSKQLTSNPAWVFCDLLTGQINKRAVSRDRLDLDSIVEWADYCDEIPTPPSNRTYRFPRFASNFIIDYATTLQSIINRICSASQAGFNIVDGKYGVLVDKNKTVPVQVFTPRNSSRFSSTRNYARNPHGVKVTYVDPNRLWQPSELVVYDDGYDRNTASQDELDDLIAFACTNEEQAYRFGRYMLAQNRLRQEKITINVDFEYLVCTRGDYVQFTHDVMRVGGSPARVISVTGNRVKIDDSLETGAFSYGFVFRGSDGTIVTDTLTVVSSTEFDFDGVLFPDVGDLVVIGIVDSIVYDCIVQSIDTGDDLTATLTLVEKADAIYQAETLTDFPDYEPDITPLLGSEDSRPTIVRNLSLTDSGYFCNESNSGYVYYADIAWESPEYGAVEHYEIHINNGNGYTLLTTIRGSVYRYIVNQDNLDVLHTFKVVGVSANGKKLNLIDVPEVTVTPATKSTPPSNVSKIVTDITNEVIQLSWDKIPDCDVREYLIRYSPDITNVWENSVPLLKADKNLNLASTQARTGIYLIKAVDYAGNLSVTAAAAITTVPNLFNLNVIDSITDFPNPQGTFDRTELSSNAIILQDKTSGGVGIFEYYTEGYYIYEGFLDLGEIYSVRLQSQIQAEGLTDEDIMSTWTLLSEVDALANAGADDWDVETQYRSTTAFNTMSEWTVLSDIDPLSEGDQDNFTEWRKFIMGDATGRIFQFRLKLTSNRPIVTPRVFEAVIKADMPDRLESYNDLVAPDTGYTVTYSPAFKGPGTSPNIQISIDGASSGDYWVISNKDLEGFDIQFYDKNDIAVERQFDVAVKGYGRKANNII